MNSAGAVPATVMLRADLQTAQATGADILSSSRAQKRMRLWRVARGHHLTGAGGAR